MNLYSFSGNVNFQKILICMSQSICCIYHSSGEQAPKTQCYCSGSVKQMHASCLLTWFKQKLKKTCELCHKSDQEKGQTIYAEVIVISKPFSIELYWFSWSSFYQGQHFCFHCHHFHHLCNLCHTSLPLVFYFPPFLSLSFCPSLLPCFCWEIEQNKDVW